MNTFGRVKKNLRGMLELVGLVDRLASHSPVPGERRYFDSMAVVTDVTIVEDESAAPVEHKQPSAEAVAPISPLAALVAQRAAS